MAKVSMRAPDGASGMSIEGIQIDVIDGLALVDEQFVDIMRSHGFQTEGGQLVSGSRGELVQMVAIPSRTIAESLSDEELRAFAALSDDDKSKFWDGFRGGIQKYPAVVAQQKADAEAKAAAEVKSNSDAAAAAKAKADADAAAAKAKADADAKAAADAAAKK